MRRLVQGSWQGLVALIGIAGLVTACGDEDSDQSQGGTTTTSTSHDVAVTQTDLTSDQASVAANRDKNLVNAWGIAVNDDAPNGPIFWVSAADKGVATTYLTDGSPAGLVVTIPHAKGNDVGSPTGQVYNDSADFDGDKFIFATEDGLIAGWKSGTKAVKRADRSSAKAGYKGLAIIERDTIHVLAAANFHGGKVDIFDPNYEMLSEADSFTDDTLPKGFAPFNIVQISDKVYVSYAKQDADKEDDMPGKGNGYVNVFEVDGTFDKRLISKGALDSPWGMAVAPSGYGALSGMLLVGNFGDGAVNAYDFDGGKLVGRLTDDAGKALHIDGLWSLTVVNNREMQGQLFFSAGPLGETHGLFGMLEPMP